MMTGPKFIPGLIKASLDERFLQEQTKEIKNYSRGLPKLDISRVNFSAFRPWVHSRLTEMMGGEDDVISGLVVNTLTLHDPSEKMEPGELVQLLVPFTGKSQAQMLVGEIWGWIAKAQEADDGIPEEFREAYMKQSELERQESEERKRAAFEEHKSRGLRSRSRHSPSWGRNTTASSSGSNHKKVDRTPPRTTMNKHDLRDDAGQSRDYRYDSDRHRRRRSQSRDQRDKRYNVGRYHDSRSNHPQSPSPPRSLQRENVNNHTRFSRPLSPAPSNRGGESSSSYSSEDGEDLEIIDNGQSSTALELRERARRLMDD